MNHLQLSDNNMCTIIVLFVKSNLVWIKNIYIVYDQYELTEQKKELEEKILKEKVKWLSIKSPHVYFRIINNSLS